MTVQELIDELQKVEDKQRIVNIFDVEYETDPMILRPAKGLSIEDGELLIL